MGAVGLLPVLKAKVSVVLSAATLPSVSLPTVAAPGPVNSAPNAALLETVTGPVT